MNAKSLYKTEWKQLFQLKVKELFRFYEGSWTKVSFFKLETKFWIKNMYIRNKLSLIIIVSY